MKMSRQAKGGKAKTPAKKAAARANGKLGGRPRNADKAKTPHLFVGVFGYNLSPEDTDDKSSSEDVRFTAVVEATDINAAISLFRRLFRHPKIKESLDGTYVELMSCVEIEKMPAEGLITFYESTGRMPEEPTYWGSINASAPYVPEGYEGIARYGYKGPFVKGKHWVEPTEEDETQNSPARAEADAVST